MEVEVTIEIPKGTRNKYEMDRRTVGSGWTAPSSPPPSTVRTGAGRISQVWPEVAGVG
jgi:hypothetical protein